MSDESRTEPRWWLSEGDRDPIGPVSTEVLTEWLRAGLVQEDALVCAAESDEWQSLAEVDAFQDARRKPRRRFDAALEASVVDIDYLLADTEPPESFDTAEVTVVAVPFPSRRAAR